jgi:hypothetical protein
MVVNLINVQWQQIHFSLFMKPTYLILTEEQTLPQNVTVELTLLFHI